VAAVDDLADLAVQLNSAASEQVSPADRVASLRRLRDRLLTVRDHGLYDRGEVTSLLGQADSYIGSLELQREGEAMGQELAKVWAREDADIRELLIADGTATPEELAGWMSHDELDAASRDGTLEEGVVGLFKELLHPRSRTGEFRDKPGQVPKPKGRGAGAMSATADPRTFEPPHAGAHLPGGPNLEPPAGPQSPGDAPKVPKESYEEKRARLDKRVYQAAAKGVNSPPPPQSPGTKKKRRKADTSPTPDASAPRQFEHASQKELLAYAETAASQPSTVDAYSVRDPKTGKRVYDESRRALHERILSKLLDNVPSQPAGKARVFFSGGGYAAGKGGVIDAHPDAIADALVHPDDPQRGVIIDPDRIKAMLPEFQALLESDPEANLLTYEEAWDISQELQRRAIEKNANVCVDGISDTSPEDMLNRVKSFTKAGYKNPKVVYVTVPTEEAIQRAAKRSREAKKPSDRRFIPDVIMRSVHRDVSATLPGLLRGAKDAGLSVEVWDNNQGKDADGQFNPPKQILDYDPAGKGGPHVLDTKLWEDFLAKKDEPIHGVELPAGPQSPGSIPAAAFGAYEDAVSFLDHTLDDLGLESIDTEMERAGLAFKLLNKAGLTDETIRGIIAFVNSAHSESNPLNMDAQEVVGKGLDFHDMLNHGIPATIHDTLKGLPLPQQIRDQLPKHGWEHLTKPDEQDLLQGVPHSPGTGHEAAHQGHGLVGDAAHLAHDHAANAAHTVLHVPDALVQPLHGLIQHAPTILHAVTHLLASTNTPFTEEDYSLMLEEAKDDPVPDELTDELGEFRPEKPLPGEGYVDLPFESGSADPQPLEYADLGEDKKYVPEEDFRAVQKRHEDAAAEEAKPSE
jgi:hypothetical protein